MAPGRGAPLARLVASIAVVVLVLAAVPWVARAAEPTPLPATPSGMSMDARALVQGHARTGSWMAVRVDLANDGPPFTGELRLLGGTQGRTRFAVPVDLPTTSRKAYTLHAQTPAFGGALEVALVADEKVVTKRTVAFAPHDPGQLVVGVVAERPGPLVASLGRLRDPSGPQPAVVALGPADLPERPEAWSVLDRLVWQDVDAGQLTTEQLAALRTWLAGGGRLAIVGGSGGLGLLAGFADELLPYRPTATIDVDPGALRGLLGGTLPRGATELPALAGELATGSRALATSGDRAIAADRPFGSGAVTLAGFDPATGWLAESTAADVLWAGLVPGRGTSRTPLIVGDDGSVVSSLGTLPALALPSIEALLLLLLGYILLVGPVNYLVLRRLDRREWAWVTIPLLIAGFTVGAFAIGATLRGNDLIVNQLAFVRGSPGTDAGQAQVYLGIFSPTRGSFEVGVPGGVLLSAPYGGESFGQAGAQGLDLVQGDPSRVRGLAVGYGTMRAIRAEAPVPAPRVAADLRLDGSRVVGTIRNDSAVTLLKPAVVLASGVAVLDDLAPGETAQVDIRSAPDMLGRALSERVFGQLTWGSDGMPTGDFLRDQVRRQLVDVLTYDPTFGSNGTLPADGPVLLAWGAPGLFPVTVAGEEPRTAGETLYYIPVGLTASGAVTFRPELVRSSVIEAKAQTFSRDATNIVIGGGTATLAYRPIPVAGTLRATRLVIGVNLGAVELIPPGGRTVEPGPPGDGPDASPSAAPTPAPSAGTGEVPPLAPDQPVRPDQPLFPVLELFDRTAGGWRTLPDLETGAAIEIRDPARYVDPASGTVLVRLTHEGQDASGFQLALQIEGVLQ